MATAEVKRILKELDECPELQLPKQQKRSAEVAEWNADCAEIYSPPRITAIASRMNMKSAWALDLTTMDDQGNPWDFSLASQRKKAMKMLKKDKPLLLVACPMCGPFSSINDINYVKMNSEEIHQKLESAMMHMRFALCLCLQQLNAGRLFMFEHPAGASSWGTKMMQEMLGKEGVFLSKFDFCQLGMVVRSANGERASAKKRTSVMTNSKQLAEILRQAQCDGSHRHEQLEGGKAKQCEVYPEKFVQLICTALKREIADAKWRRRVAEKFDIGPAVEKLMAIQAKMELEEPPHEADGAIQFRELYADYDFVDDVSGLRLDKSLAIAARKVEIEFFKNRGVYEKVAKEPWMHVITTKWLDVNKNDEATPNYRARLVGREIAWDKRDDLYAATPPLESLKTVISACASAQDSAVPFRIMAIDVKRAYFYAPATFSSPSASALTWSCSHRYRTLRCLNLPRPARRTIPIAALASVCTVHSTAVPKSASMVMRPKPWAAPFVRAYSSASALESATVACVLDHDFKQWLPQRIIPPLVLLHVVLQPAQSLSVKTWMWLGRFCHTNCCSYLGAPTR